MNVLYGLLPELFVVQRTVFTTPKLHIPLNVIFVKTDAYNAPLTFFNQAHENELKPMIMNPSMIISFSFAWEYIVRRDEGSYIN